MSHTIGVDPGALTISCALADDSTGRVVACAHLRPKSKRFDDLMRSFFLWCANFSHLRPRGLIERMQIYKHGQRGKNATHEDLLRVTTVAGGAAGVIAAFGGAVEIRKPREWKGTMDGDAFCKRVERRLDENERALLAASCPPFLRHNVLDAIGLAILNSGRLERRRVITE